MNYTRTSPPDGITCDTLTLWECTQVTCSGYSDEHSRAAWRTRIPRSEALRRIGRTVLSEGIWRVREHPRRVEIRIRKVTLPTCTIGGPNKRKQRRSFFYGDDNDAYGIGHDDGGLFILQRHDGEDTREYVDTPENPMGGWKRLGVRG